MKFGCSFAVRNQSNSPSTRRRPRLPWSVMLSASWLLACGATQVTSEQGASEEAAVLKAAVAEGRVRIALAASPPSAPWIDDVVFADGANQVRFATADGHVYALDATTGAVTTMHQVDGSPDLMLVPQTALAVATSAPAPRIYELNAGVELVRFADWADAKAAATSVNGHHLIVARGAELGVWYLVEQASAYKEGESVQDFLNRQQPRRVVTLPAPASALGVGSSGNFAIAIDDGATKGTVYAWDKEHPDDLEFLGRTNGSVRQLIWSRDEQVLVAVNPDDTLWVMLRGKKGFAPWATSLKASEVGFTDEGLLLVHGTDGTLRALQPNGGAEQWSVQGVGRCAAAPGRLACTDGTAVLMMQSATGTAIARVVAWSGAHMTLLNDGTHVGTAEAGWVKLTGPDGDVAVSPTAWSNLVDPQGVATALSIWGKP